MMMQMYLPPWMHVRQFASLEVAPTRNMRIKFRTWRISRYASQLKSKLAPTLTHNFLLFRTQLERTWRGLNRSEIGIKFAKPARTWVTHNVYAVSKPRAHNWVQALQKTFERWYEENCDAAKGKRTPSVAGELETCGGGDQVAAARGKRGCSSGSLCVQCCRYWSCSSLSTKCCQAKHSKAKWAKANSLAGAPTASQPYHYICHSQYFSWRTSFVGHIKYIVLR